jgi:hypothetical protein
MKRWLLVLIVLGLFMLPTACHKSPRSSSSEDAVVPVVSGEWGGYQPTDEDEFFAMESSGTPYDGDEEGEEESNEDVEDDPDYQNVNNDPNRVIYLLRVDWGQLAYNPAFKGELDWSGTISTTRGAILVCRTYRFEPILNGDHIVRPRTSIKEVSWVSKTYVHHDGVMFAIVTLPDDEDASTEVPFTSQYYSRTFTLGDLEKVNLTEPVDESGNRIAFHGAKTKLGDVIDGVLAGRWANGKYLGRWIALDGAPVGRLGGHYGHNAAGRRVFFGKYVSTDGKFKGLLKGGWCPAPFTMGFTGWFLGIYTDENVQPAGILGGHYVKSLFLKGGWFRGVWHNGIPEGWNPSEPPDPEDENGTTPNP